MPDQTNMEEFEGQFDPRLAPDPNFKPPDISALDETKDELPSIGWRAWSVSAELPRYGSLPRLYSVSQGDYFWVPRREMRAVCERGCDDAQGDEEPAIGVPGEHCGCGFYSAKTRDHLMGMHYQTYNGETDGMYKVIGKVANWGKVIEGSLGWRAEFSYPVQLFVPYECWRLVEPLSKAYGIPVVLDNFLKPFKRRAA